VRDGRTFPGLRKLQSKDSRIAYYLAATLQLSDLVRAQLAQSHVICDRYLASPLSLMIGESAIEETEARCLTEPFASYRVCPI
jgi:thymidylate kinase